MALSPYASAHAALLQKAMQQHAAGELDAARDQYLRLLKAAPRHADALHMLGVLEAQLGRHTQAAELIGRAITVLPGEAMFHNNLGNVLLETGDIDAAEVRYRRAFELDPRRPDVLNNLGVLAGRRGRAEEGERLLREAIEVSPNFVGARENLANQLHRAGRLEEALEECVQALLIKPRQVAVRMTMAAVCVSMGRTDQAEALYRQWLDEDPDNVEARYLLHACTGQEVPERSPDNFVVRTFDAFAGSFDAKLASLAYKAPQHVADAVARWSPPPAAQFDIVDAGCGTGLCGPLLKPWARTLVGVDLSPGMLRRAELRGDYDALVEGELVAFLATRSADCDLLVSADTLNYFGVLDGFAAAARGALRTGGLLVCTVEAHADDEGASDYRLHGHGRYSHRRSYVESTWRAAGLTPVATDLVVLREEAGRPVEGWLLCARAT